MPNKQPNYLATRIEQQAAKGTTLPASVNRKLAQLLDYTSELKSILIDSLPNEILQTLQVVGFDDNQLTLAVGSQTAANHLIYLNKPLISLITSQSLTFKELKNIKVIVTYLPNKGNQSLLTLSDDNGSNSKNSQAKTKSNNTKNLSVSPTVKGLTPKTKQTITQTIEHVISDEALKKSLKKLLD